ncbi:hypothetical protein NIES592_01905 [Fischerella major NIES-592]|uniref:Uncharacterized protein n=2 Tax=Fischerella TaxID=1190 RepID=A0A1U7H592_9CYAN|nr:hypothetical protein NIES592_01905 [Fischerella major NIES-592]PMB40886.1 hypothetical protein CEN41_18465 [Fischerella thermalis CCMEE 5330]BAU08217.1 hypothetical protein FIS3754_41590 [Fischerella sp. NIES-3754]BCX10580.1 MAG: hypothetical protein KatS3mg066_4439 [Fischerella sp.]
MNDGEQYTSSNYNLVRVGGLCLSSVYPAKMSINLLHSLLAARTFTELGKLDQLLTWEKDKSLAVV